LPDLTSGNSIPLDELAAAAKMEGSLTTIALPHNWANYGEIIETFKTRYGLTINELNPDASSADELIEGIRIEGELVFFQQRDRHWYSTCHLDYGLIG
jgi:hypothetical protein